MPKSSEFVLKDSPPELIKASGVDPKGRTYCAELAKEPGGMRVEEILLGTKLAFLAITDDREGTLEEVGKVGPYHIEALKQITGSEDEAHAPLTHILERHFSLKCDEILSLSGWSGGHPIDTQGYIAHNDETIVVAFRCTTSVMDWMANFSVVSSAWEIDEDAGLGHSGYCSCLLGAGRMCIPDPENDKPRVHTGFYNNMLASIPYLERHVNPLLASDQPPRTLYVVGHSLGAGISTLATIYFLEQFRWKDLPHRLVNVSDGTPRSVKGAMRERVDGQLRELRPLDKAKICRVVMDEDVVAKVPPAPMGYAHVGKLVLLTEDGRVLVGPKQDDAHVIDDEELRDLCDANPELKAVMEEEKRFEETEIAQSPSTEGMARGDYEKMMELMPKPFRDHCPDCYLAPLLKLNSEVNDLP